MQNLKKMDILTFKSLINRIIKNKKPKNWPFARTS
jgi:hypothetical protein